MQCENKETLRSLNGIQDNIFNTVVPWLHSAATLLPKSTSVFFESYELWREIQWHLLYFQLWNLLNENQYVLKLSFTAFLIFYNLYYVGGARWRGWLRPYATSRKVAGSIPDDVIGIFQWHIPSGRTMVDSASNRNEYQEYFLRVKAAGT